MELILPLLEEPEVYEYLPNGFAKGKGTVAYVERILRRYGNYRRKITATPSFDDASAGVDVPTSSDG